MSGPPAVGAITALLATMAPQLAHAATKPAWDTTSNGNVYLMNNGTAVQYADDTLMDWNPADGVVLTANPVPADLGDLSWAPFPAQTAAGQQYIPFLSTVGSERTPSAWKAWADFSTVDTGALLPNVSPGALPKGAPGGVKSAGGTYSMGIAYTDSAIVASTHVLKAFYVTVNIDAGTGAWKFSVPTVVCTPTTIQHTTTTTLVANPTTGDVGTSTSLTATVTSDVVVPGNVQFTGGGLGTVALAAGTVTKPVNIALAGANTFSASYVDNSITSPDGCTINHFAASSSGNTVVTGTVVAVPLPPNAPSENVLNATTAHGATVAFTESATAAGAVLTVASSNNGKAVNTFVYSAPIFLGQLTVSATGTITVDLSTLPAGTHKLVIVDPTTGDVLGWASFTKTTAAISPSITKTINADVATAGSVPTDGEFSIIDTSATTVNLTNPALVNGQSVVSGALGTFKVTDLRQVSKQGWDLKTTVTSFVKGSDSIANSALGITPIAVSNAGSGATAPTLGTATVSGSAIYPWNFASLAAGSYSGVSIFNADLVFTAPAAKPAGTYSGTLTLTLISK